ncbi:DMT family transporter [Novosphingobium sp. 1949]|uniref:DMT family transporter n=1 Tax=Novosphingobium organovorum TaxID=2930092 RepID=A0ABT0BAR5_9SPHN|nr:DMT family transporter [Novosphingobium organovorum]MCJ2182128.1 DMT family transporter [Novosphingobium organovorum]
MIAPVSASRAAPAPCRPTVPFLAVVAGIGVFSAMDAAMKGAALVGGVYTALLLRNALGTGFAAAFWLTGKRALPAPATLRLHAFRAAITTAMAALFFYGLVRVPMAEAIAISFIAPIVALFLAALLLGEVIRPQAILASLLGILGVVVIAAGRMGGLEASGETIAGIAAILLSALFYALNLVLQRQQALLASPREIALFQNLFATGFTALAAPWLFVAPGGDGWAPVALAALAALLATGAHLLLSWGYARAETQVLVTGEYTGFLWAAVLGWLFFDEKVAPATVAGAMLILGGCWIGARNKVSAGQAPTIG